MGIYEKIDDEILCIDTEATLFETDFFAFKKKEDERYVSVKRIVEGNVDNPSVNAQRLVRILFANQYPYFVVPKKYWWL